MVLQQCNHENSQEQQASIENSVARASSPLLIIKWFLIVPIEGQTLAL